MEVTTVVCVSEPETYSSFVLFVQFIHVQVVQMSNSDKNNSHDSRLCTFYNLLFLEKSEDIKEQTICGQEISVRPGVPAVCRRFPRQ